MFWYEKSTLKQQQQQQKYWLLNDKAANPRKVRKPGKSYLGRTGYLTNQVQCYKQVYLYLLILGQEVKEESNNVA